MFKKFSGAESTLLPGLLCLSLSFFPSEKVIQYINLPTWFLSISLPLPLFLSQSLSHLMKSWKNSFN